MIKDVLIPDLGDVDTVDVIELVVAEGDVVEAEQTLVTLESEKASMDIPSPFAGTVKALKIATGDKVKQGTLIAQIELAEAGSSQAAGAQQAEEKVADQSQQKTSEGETEVLTLPDLGDVSDVSIIEIPIAVGDHLEIEQTLMTLESEKASMDIPATAAGEVIEILVEQGQKVNPGDAIVKIATAAAGDSDSPKPSQAKAPSPQQPSVASTASKNASSAPKFEQSRAAPVPDYPVTRGSGGDKVIHASPAVRRFARELGADLSKVNGSGRKQRILKSDVQSFVKYELSRPKATATTGGALTPEMPKIDFSQYGDVEEVPLSRIQKVSSVALHRNWVVVPHVTQHHEVDITSLEEFRKSMKSEGERHGVRITSLGFIMKAVVKALAEFPKFNSSLSADGETIILKKYFHVGVAIDTPDGLVVPVIRDVNKKTVIEIAQELGDLSVAAREKKLSVNDMRGSCFTISSLGGIGGTAFTPIVNWPDVAILGVSRHQMKPQWDGHAFQPRLMLPLSLSYDHRVIDGADAARFIVYLGQILEDIRRIIM